MAEACGAVATIDSSSADVKARARERSPSCRPIRCCSATGASPASSGVDGPAVTEAATALRDQLEHRVTGKSVLIP